MWQVGGCFEGDFGGKVSRTWWWIKQEVDKEGPVKENCQVLAGSWMAVETVPVEEVVEEDQSDSHVWWTKSEEPLS